METSKSQLLDKDVWAARFQTAGRGQRGNSWSSEAGLNLTFSIYLEPTRIRACDQFAISQAISLGVCRYLEGRGIGAEVKWPNDIYVGSNKICGILIAHTLSGTHIKDTVAGIGLNVNQLSFPPEVPNPTSMSLETGRKYDLESELEALLKDILDEYGAIGEDTAYRYLQKLYRKGMPHTFTVAATGAPHDGCIPGVAQDARLAISDSSGEEHLFAFKEIIY